MIISFLDLTLVRIPRGQATDGYLLDLGQAREKLERTEALRFTDSSQLLNRSRMPWVHKLNELSIRRQGLARLVALSLYGARSLCAYVAPLLEA